MNPQMQRAVGPLGRALNDVLNDTAASVGRGDEYAQAMQLYAKAKSWQKFGADTWQFIKRAAPTAIGVGAGGRPDGSFAPARLRTVERKKQWPKTDRSSTE